MTHFQYSRWFQFGLALLASQVATVAHTVSTNAQVLVAQITPDDSLGNESSLITEQNAIEQIGGGAVRGNNLFHSFQDFNVNLGQQVYFLNPEGINTILSRITGGNLSEIDGLLGVDGTADLFLLNPNGITFGPNAQLDIRGAFTASTADSLEFIDGSLFSAANPQGASVLTISVPLGVQFSHLSQGNITNTGNLEAGGDLTLSGHQLYLEGQLMAGNHLTLQAQDTVTIRDTATAAFTARTGDDLTIQGAQGIDIWTLQHLEQTPFISAGNIALISDGTISGDAHFESGGDLQFLTLAGTPGNFVSFHDPIIFADGDVIFGDYEGAALKVEATGSIQAGDIRITGPDTTLTADGSGSDEDLLASSNAAILRAGVITVSDANVPQTAGGTSFVDNLVSDQPPGSIVVNAINTMSLIDGEAGGPIILEADGDITTNANLDSLSRTASGNTSNGGDISISSLSGNIVINGRLSSFSQALRDGDAGQGGDISISSTSGNITTNDRINSFSLSQQGTIGNASNAGNVSISSISGTLTINERINTFSEASVGMSSQGGNISLISTSGDIITGERINAASNALANGGRSGTGGDITIFSEFGNITALKDVEAFSESFNSDSGNGGNISIGSTFGDIDLDGEIEAFSISRAGNGGDGGDITISSVFGDISTETFVRSFSFVREEGGRAGNGGDISLSSGSGNITANDRLSSFSSSASVDANGGSGNGGNVFISSTSGDISTNRIDSSSSFYTPEDDVTFSGRTGAVGNGGDISISSISGDITNNRLLFSGSVSRNGDVGQGGDISLSTREGTIFNNNNEISTISASEIDGETGAGGNVTLQAARIFDVQISTVSSGSTSGNVEIKGTDDSLIINNLNLITSGQVNVVNPVVDDGQIISLELSNFDQSGEIVIVSEGDLILNNVELLSDANRSANAGDVSILSNNGSITLDNSRIFSNTNTGSSGNGGNVLFQSSESITLDNESIINTDTSGTGNAGIIQISTPLVNIQNGSQVTAATNSTQVSSVGGDIRVEADTINLSGNDTEISVNTMGIAAAGSITIDPFISDSIEIITIGDGPQFSASTAIGSSGRGGDIIIQNADIAILRNTDLITSSDGAGDAGNIVVKNVDVLLLRQGSLIQAGASAGGNGGDIDIDANLVLTVPDEDNDILADTTTGTGGNINITADQILGFEEVQAFSNALRGNGRNDISAQSERGGEGEVSINNLAVDPNQGLTELPTGVVDPANQIAQGCGVEDSSIADNPTGDFIITGRGGQPLNPTDISNDDVLLDDLGPTTVDAEASSPAIERAINHAATTPLLANAQEAVVTETGDVFLVTEGSWQPSVSCASLH